MSAVTGVRGIIEAEGNSRTWLKYENSGWYAGQLRKAGLVIGSDALSTAHFIATFDPEHVALMEALFEAWLDYDGIDRSEIEAAGKALLAYRRENGLG